MLLLSIQISSRYDPKSLGCRISTGRLEIRSGRVEDSLYESTTMSKRREGLVYDTVFYSRLASMVSDVSNSPGETPPLCPDSWLITMCRVIDSCSPTKGGRISTGNDEVGRSGKGF